MPNGDRTGPDGSGPMTGRGTGICSGHGYPGYLDKSERGHRHGHGKRGGRGRGYQRRYGEGFSVSHPKRDLSITEEKTMLEKEIGFFKKRMEELNKRLETLANDQERNQS